MSPPHLIPTQIPSFGKVFVLLIYIEQVLLDDRLDVTSLAGSRVDEDRKDPGVSVRHVDVPCKILRSGDGTALGVDTPFEGCVGTKGLQGAGLTAYRQRSYPCLFVRTLGHDAKQLHERFGADGILRCESATVLDDSVLDGDAAPTPVVAQQVLAVMDGAGQGITRAQVAEERLGVEVIRVDIRLLDDLRQGFGIMGV